MESQEIYHFQLIQIDNKPQHIILVHGDTTNMSRLKQSLENNKFENIQVYTPKNCKTVEIMIRGEKIGKQKLKYRKNCRIIRTKNLNRKFKINRNVLI